MLYIITVNETSPEANWNMQTDRQADRQDHLQSQADALTKNDTERQKSTEYNKEELEIQNEQKG